MRLFFIPLLICTLTVAVSLTIPMGKLHGNAPNGRGNTILASTNNVVDDKITITAENDVSVTIPPIEPERDGQLLNSIALIAGTTVGAGQTFPAGKKFSIHCINH
mmetsp:Transcript_28400/g.27206  ORF Transcript_28400/g.27206 Transcript_28400/m.27206 type:complete len:105 (-) Transcript_28400:25-339(-)